MYSRKYSLKGRYRFNSVLKFGEGYESKSFILKVLNGKPDETYKFAVITSNRFNKKTTVQNAVRRLFSKAIEENLEKFKDNYYYVFIPKKTVFDEDDKIRINAKSLGTEIDKILSEMVFV